MRLFTESVIEQATHDWLGEQDNLTALGYAVVLNYVGPTLANMRDVLLPKFLRREVRVKDVRR